MYSWSFDSWTLENFLRINGDPGYQCTGVFLESLQIHSGSHRALDPIYDIHALLINVWT